MKIKSILAISAFAASMSAFAQSGPAAPAGGGKQSPRSSADRASIRNAVQDFHDQQAAPAAGAGTLPPMPAPRVSAMEDDSARTAAVRREQLRKSVQRHEQRQAWAEKREVVSESKHLRMQKRQERQLHKHELSEAVPEVAHATRQ